MKHSEQQLRMAFVILNNQFAAQVQFSEMGVVLEDAERIMFDAEFNHATWCTDVALPALRVMSELEFCIADQNRAHDELDDLVGLLSNNLDRLFEEEEIEENPEIAALVKEGDFWKIVDYRYTEYYEPN